ALPPGLGLHRDVLRWQPCEEIRLRPLHQDRPPPHPDPALLRAEGADPDVGPFPRAGRASAAAAAGDLTRTLVPPRPGLDAAVGARVAAELERGRVEGVPASAT